MFEHNDVQQRNNSAKSIYLSIYLSLSVCLSIYLSMCKIENEALLRDFLIFRT